MTDSTQCYSIATLAGGCFWCLEAVFEQVQGVQSVISGYMGGSWNNPDYADVCTGQSGHAEVVNIRYDTAVINFQQLLEIFFTLHDPTSLNRQGNDRGTQYRSAVFFHDAAQQSIAQEVIAHLQRQLSVPIVTEVVAATQFYPAEREHQHYFALHPDQAYCVQVVAAKVIKFQQHFPRWIQSS